MLNILLLFLISCNREIDSNKSSVQKLTSESEYSDPYDSNDSYVPSEEGDPVFTNLRDSVINYNLEEVKRLVELGHDINQEIIHYDKKVNNIVTFTIFTASNLNNIEEKKILYDITVYLIDNGANLDGALQIALEKNEFDFLKVILKKEPHRINEYLDEYTLLSYSIIFLDREIVNFLIKSGADIRDRGLNVGQLTPLENAIEYEKDDIVLILISKLEHFEIDSSKIERSDFVNFENIESFINIFYTKNGGEKLLYLLKGIRDGIFEEYKSSLDSEELSELMTKTEKEYKEGLYKYNKELSKQDEIIHKMELIVLKKQSDELFEKLFD